jgi:hypothetical protein
MSVEQRINEQQTATTVKLDQRSRRRPPRAQRRARRVRRGGSGDRGSEDGDGDGSSDDDGLIRPDQLYAPAEVARIEGICPASVYIRLSRGEYQAYKDGKLTRIPGSSILARRAAKLTPATFAPPRPQTSNFHTIRKDENRPAV